jgi:glycosyltransferase involved in cell wall biosynthesis
MNKSVLIVTPFFRPNVGGVETRFNEITRALVKRNINVNVLTFQPLITKNVRGDAYEESGSMKIWRYNWFGGDLFHKLLKYPALEIIYLSVPLFFLSLYFLLKNKSKLNIVTVHAAGLNAALACIFLKYIFNVKFVFSTHALYTFNSESMFAKVVKFIGVRSDAILAIGQASKDELAAIGIPNEKIFVQPTWVNQDIFIKHSKDEAKRDLGLADKFIVGFIGRLNEIKGVRLLIEVAKELKDKEGIIFMFIGTGDLEAEVKSAADENNNILYYGMKDNYQLTKFYNACDIFAALALYEEGFSRSTVEAISCGVPVIASNRGCLPEIIENGKSGWLIDPELQLVKDKILEINKNAHELDNLSSYAFKISREKYNEDQVMRLVSIYFND